MTASKAPGTARLSPIPSYAIGTEMLRVTRAKAVAERFDVGGEVTVGAGALVIRITRCPTAPSRRESKLVREFREPAGRARSGRATERVPDERKTD